MAVTTIDIDYYEELKSKAEKWDEKQTPYYSKQDGYDICGFYSICKCSAKVYADDNIYESYCTECGQKLKWD